MVMFAWYPMRRFLFSSKARTELDIAIHVFPHHSTHWPINDAGEYAFQWAAMVPKPWNSQWLLSSIYPGNGTSMACAPMMLFFDLRIWGTLPRLQCLRKPLSIKQLKEALARTGFVWLWGQYVWKWLSIIYKIHPPILMSKVSSRWSIVMDLWSNIRLQSHCGRTSVDLVKRSIDKHGRKRVVPWQFYWIDTVWFWHVLAGEKVHQIHLCLGWYKKGFDWKRSISKRLWICSCFVVWRQEVSITNRDFKLWVCWDRWWSWLPWWYFEGLQPYMVAHTLSDIHLE